MRKIVLALGVIAILVMAGCASDKGISETGYSNKPLTDRQGHKLESADAKRLYESARDFLMHGQPSRALPLYAEVSARFPFSEYAPQSELETVAAHYEAGDYDQAIDAADRFIKQHPRNPHVDYVYYMRGLSNYARNNPGLLGSNPDKRNVDYLKQAFNDFSLLVENYPNSDYAKDAQLHMIDIRNRVAAFDLRIAEYYYKRRAYVASARRAESIVKHYQGSDSVPRALEIMEQSYAKLNLPDLAEDTRAILQVSYPNYLLHRDEFYRQQAGEAPNYTLPDLGAPPAAGKPASDPASDDDSSDNG
ncbi:outer membrane protein assembly factor BamD [Salinisphaera sp.]|uniref:outer membrane protein assembly factor BamD n=1 Tax=Salinisphaera sp. TaxID=1914330 RepID=UPI002D780011|nr:outer membrane protein assembly factor BamD [Salinisphaera sp.]HET7313182.1 outer membrane protein assembly factor BamD [Salinisphaera sp.]